MTRFPQPALLIDIQHKIKIRTFRQLFVFFGLSGYQLYVSARPSRWLLAFGKEVKWHPKVRILWGPSRRRIPAILCTDVRHDTVTKGPALNKTIHVVYDYSPTLTTGPSDFRLPFPMHPQMYFEYNELPRLSLYRGSRRRIRVLFGGNNSKGYHTSIVHDVLRMMTRDEIMAFVRSEELSRVVTTAQELNSLQKADYVNEFILIDPTVRINQRYWLSTISQADFFLCPPGVMYPFSHNSIESMAVGTIPLINYPNWFIPALEDGKNCIAFQDGAGLRNALKSILSMSDREIKTLRHEVLEYYDEHLSPERFMRAMLESPSPEIRLHMIEEHSDFLQHLSFAKDGWGAGKP